MHIKTRKTTSCKTGLSSSMLLADIKKTAKTLGTTRLTKAQYLKHGSYSEATVSRRFGSWTKAMEIAGLKSGIYYPVSEYELLLNIGEVWKKTGQQPRLTDMKIPVSRYGSWTYKTHFGSWSIALVKFNSYAKSKRICLPISKNEIARSNNHYKSNSHSPKRKINLALRYSILKRDNYRCCVRTFARKSFWA